MDILLCRIRNPDHEIIAAANHSKRWVPVVYNFDGPVNLFARAPVHARVAHTGDSIICVTAVTLRRTVKVRWRIRIRSGLTEKSKLLLQSASLQAMMPSLLHHVEMSGYDVLSKTNVSASGISRCVCTRKSTTFEISVAYKFAIIHDFRGHSKDGAGLLLEIIKK